MVHEPERTYSQIKTDAIIPEVDPQRTFVYINTDVRDEPEDAENTCPAGYKNVSYISTPVLKSEWMAARASHEDITLAEARTLTTSYELALELISSGGGA